MISKAKFSICLNSHLNWTYNNESLLFHHQTENPWKNRIPKSRCLLDNINCSGQREHGIKIGDLGIQIDDQRDIKEFKTTSRNQCIFPFKYENKNYSSCTKADLPQYAKWCAVSINNETRELKDFGYCDESCFNNQQRDNTAIIVTVSICTIFILSSIALAYYCYVKRKKGNEEKNTAMKENIDMVNDQLVLNEQAADLSDNGDNKTDRSKFEIGQNLGSSNFGSVHEGMAEDLNHSGHSDELSNDMEVFYCNPIETNQKEKGQSILLYLSYT